jgi:hypothetical protein
MTTKLTLLENLTNDIRKLTTTEWTLFLTAIHNEHARRKVTVTNTLKRDLYNGQIVKVTGRKVNGEGIIRKVNRTRCLVVVDGLEWNVPMTMITPLE